MNRRFITLSLVFATIASREVVARADDSSKPAAAAPSANSAAKPADKPADAKADANAKAGDAAADGERDPNAVFLHISTSQPVTIERDDTGEVICTSPCNKNVPVNGVYRIGGARPSPAFSLSPSSEGKADVKVAPGSKGEFWVGVGLMGVGAALIAGGVGTALYWTANKPAVPGGDGVNTDNRYTYAMMAVSGLIILGVVAEIYGGASVINNIKTKVKGNVQQAKSRGVDLPSRPSQMVALPRPNYVPILGGTF